MIGETKETFIARVREASAGRSEPTPLPDDLEIARVISPEQDLIEVFLERVAQAGMQGHRVKDLSTLPAKIVGLAAALGAESAIVPAEPFPGREEMIAALEAEGVVIVDPDDPDVAFEAAVGITGVSCAVAETASLVVISGEGRRRLASLAVPSHIAVVASDQIMPDLLDWAERSPAELPAGEVLISGPSKTADIEELVTGVHGPKHVHVVVVG